MAEPTINRRLQKGFIVLSSDPDRIETARAAAPEGWSVTVAEAPAGVGQWSDILLHRFLILDAESLGQAAVAQVQTLRREMMVNIPVLVLGGDTDLQDALRQERADRFFAVSELPEVVTSFTAQYGWG